MKYYEIIHSIRLSMCYSLVYMLEELLLTVECEPVLPEMSGLY